jgi:hypothetical protein
MPTPVFKHARGGCGDAAGKKRSLPRSRII